MMQKLSLYQRCLLVFGALVLVAMQIVAHAPQKFVRHEAEISLEDFSDWVDYQHIQYRRPSLDEALESVDAAMALLTEQADFDELLDAIDEMELVCDDFFTMGNVAYIEYCKNLDNSFYNRENNLLEKQGDTLRASLESLYIAAAKSPLRQQLEDECFGEGTLTFYQTHSIYTNEAFVALSKQETDLENAYMALQNDPTVVIDGKEMGFEDACAAYPDALNDVVYPAYYDKYNPQAADIFAELVKVRKQMAQAAGYDSYADFMYEFAYERDYTPQTASTYLSQLRAVMPTLAPQMKHGSYRAQDSEQMQQQLRQTLDAMDGDLGVLFDVMQQYHLLDISRSTTKMGGSYELDLYSYYQPFVYVSPTETEEDFTTLAHEFGHFVESVSNDGCNSQIDTSEIFSQALEFLTLYHADFSKETFKRLNNLKVYDAYTVFLHQAAYADFEQRVYQLDEKNLTQEGINDVYEQVVREYGMYHRGIDWYNRQGWIDISHFFTAPYYVISYCTSADVAVQIYALEQQAPGAGIDAYWNLIFDSADYDFLELLAQNGLRSPFENGRAKQLAKQLRKLMQ